MLNFHGVMIILLYFLIIMIILKFLIIIILLHFLIQPRKSHQVSLLRWEFLTFTFPHPEHHVQTPISSILHKKTRS